MAEGEEAAPEFIKEEPTYIPLGDKHYKYGCPNCDTPPFGLKNGMEIHTHKFHSKKPLVYSFCMFSTYIYDSLNRHAKEHNLCLVCVVRVVLELNDRDCFSLNGVGINLGIKTLYHISKSWLKEVHGGWEMGWA